MYCCILWFLFIFNLFDKFQMGSKMVDDNVPDVVLQRSFRLCPPENATKYYQRIRFNHQSQFVSGCSRFKEGGLVCFPFLLCCYGRGLRQGIVLIWIINRFNGVLFHFPARRLMSLRFPISKGGADAAKPEEENIADDR